MNQTVSLALKRKELLSALLKKYVSPRRKKKLVIFLSNLPQDFHNRHSGFIPN